MSKKSTAALAPAQDTETTEELIGILTAISVVSKQMAKKLTLLEQSAGKVGGTNETAKRVSPANAN